MYLREFRKQGLKGRHFLAGLLVLITSVLLAACGDATATLPVGISPTTNPAVALTIAAKTTAATTGQPATRAATVTNGNTAQSSTSAVSNTPTIGPATYRPIIHFSSTSIAVGSSLTVSGEGYPANAKLVIQLGPQGGKVATDSRTTTDANGKFSSKVFFVTYPDGSVVKPGNSTLAVATEDGLVKASAVVAVVEAPAAKVSPTKLIQDFFTAFKSDPKTALAYLGTDLQAAIQKGQTSLPLLLGVQNVPISVDVSPVEGKPNTYDVYENFQGGKQYIQMDLAGDTDGNLKIVAIRIPNPPPAD